MADEEYPHKLGIYNTTLTVLDSKKNLVAARQNSNLADAKDVLKWLKDWPDNVKAVTAAEAAYKAKPDVETHYTLAQALDSCGRIADASPHFEELVKSLPKDDKRLLDLNMRRAAIAETCWNWELAQQIYFDVYPKLIDAKDERAINASQYYVAKLSGEGKNKEAREALIKVAEAFPKNEQAQYCRLTAAWYAVQAGDKAQAIADLEAIIKAGKKEDNLVQAAQATIDSIKAMEKEEEKRKEAEKEAEKNN